MLVGAEATDRGENANIVIMYMRYVMYTQILYRPSKSMHGKYKLGSSHTLGLVMIGILVAVSMYATCVHSQCCWGVHTLNS